MWVIILLLILGSVILFRYFNSYLGKYAIPREFKVTGREKPRFNIYHRVYFCVRFQKSFGGKEVYTFATFKSEKEFSDQMIKGMLSLTELETFFKSEAIKEGDNITIDYEFSGSEMKDLFNKDGQKKIKVHYLIISKEDFFNLFNGIPDFDLKVKISDFLDRRRKLFDW